MARYVHSQKMGKPSKCFENLLGASKQKGLNMIAKHPRSSIPEASKQKGLNMIAKHPRLSIPEASKQKSLNMIAKHPRLSIPVGD